MHGQQNVESSVQGTNTRKQKHYQQRQTANAGNNGHVTVNQILTSILLFVSACC